MTATQNVQAVQPAKKIPSAAQKNRLAKTHENKLLKQLPQEIKNRWSQLEQTLVRALMKQKLSPEVCKVQIEMPGKGLNKVAPATVAEAVFTFDISGYAPTRDMSDSIQRKYGRGKSSGIRTLRRNGNYRISFWIKGNQLFDLEYEAPTVDQAAFEDSFNIYGTYDDKPTAPADVLNGLASLNGKLEMNCRAMMKRVRETQAFTRKFQSVMQDLTAVL